LYNKFWWGILSERDNLEKVSVDGGIIIDLQKMEWECGLDWSGSGEGQVVSFCSHGVEPSDSMK
jgi:hypothetical protein